MDYYSAFGIFTFEMDELVPEEVLHIGKPPESFSYMDDDGQFRFSVEGIHSPFDLYTFPLNQIEARTLINLLEEDARSSAQMLYDLDERPLPPPKSSRITSKEDRETLFNALQTTSLKGFRKALKDYDVLTPEEDEF